MRSTVKSTSLFSAYPLKVLEKSATTSTKGENSPYLKALLSDTGRQVGNQLRVTPMRSPYTKKAETSVTIQRTKALQCVEPADKEWFNHYE